VRSRPSGRRKLHSTAHRRRAFYPEGDELPPTQFIGDDKLRDERDPESSCDGALYRLVRVELPALGGPVADPSEITLGDGTCTRSRLTHQ
jgi:hypothetical protein